jgi:hypothetical protein
MPDPPKVPPARIRVRHPFRPILSMAVLSAFSLIVVSLISFVVVVMQAAMKVLDTIGVALEGLPAALMLWMWTYISSLIELIMLFLTGQWTPLLMRVSQFLGSP